MSAQHHLVDPKTGRSAEAVWRTVSVAAGNCVDANVASTAAVIKGRDAVDWLTATGSAGAPHPRRRNGRGRRGMGVRGGMNVLWYVTRGSGITSLLLLTGSVLLGVVTSMNLTAPGLPRFVSGAMHRNVSLLALAFLGVHIATTVVDGYVAIGWVDAVVPFVSSYHPLALGLGTIAGST